MPCAAGGVSFTGGAVSVTASLVTIATANSFTSGVSGDMALTTGDVGVMAARGVRRRGGDRREAR